MDKQKLTLALTKALAYTENGGAPNLGNTKAGKTGESKSIFQFEPDTWKNYSSQVTGKSNLPLNNQNEALVVSAKVAKWVNDLSNEGDTPEEIISKVGSMWNAGAGEPNAYTGSFSDGSSSVGTNEKYGVQYNVPSYVNKVKNYANKFLSQSNKQSQSPQTSDSTDTQPIIQKMLAIINQSKSNSTPNQPQTTQATPPTTNTPNTSGLAVNTPSPTPTLTNGLATA